ncbi:MAG: MFS transporter [Acidobacteriota bacterium]|nr:MFS transporter [Acidobacteriota bacterium]
MSPQSKNLWRHQDFLKLWSAQTTSVFGSELASLAYPLTAIVILQATTFQVGLLQATGTASGAIVGLFAGVMVDRVSRKPLLVCANLGRALLAFSIPLAATLGVLRIEQLYAVAFFSGALAILSMVAGAAFLPSMLETEQLVEGNSKLGATESAAMIAGPGLSGALVQILSAPIAILIDAVSFLISAVFVWQIRAPEVLIENKKRSIWTEIGEGLRFVYGNEILRPLAESIALYFLFRQIVLTLFTLYAIRELHLEPFLLGVIFSALGFGFLFGALTVKLITNRFGIGRTMIGANLINIFALALVPLASGSIFFIVTLLVISHFLHAFGVQLNGINLMSLRQSITPNRLQGRMTASFRFVNVGVMMFGALIAGGLGEWIGLRQTMAIGAVGMLFPFLRLLFSPVRNLNEQPNEYI